MSTGDWASWVGGLIDIYHSGGEHGNYFLSAHPPFRWKEGCIVVVCADVFELSCFNSSRWLLTWLLQSRLGQEHKLALQKDCAGAFRFAMSPSTDRIQGC